MQGSVHNHVSKPLTGIQTENFCIMQPLSSILEKSRQSGKVVSSSMAESWIECTLSKSVDDAKLSGAVDALEGPGQA